MWTNLSLKTTIWWQFVMRDKLDSFGVQQAFAKIKRLDNVIALILFKPTKKVPSLLVFARYECPKIVGFL